MIVQRRLLNRQVLAAVITILVTGLCAVLALHHAAAKNDRHATEDDVARSLARGAVWIWPNSNGPVATGTGKPSYREAAVLMESLVLHAHSIEYAGRTEPVMLPDQVQVIPVIHVESAVDAMDEFTSVQRDAIVAAVLRQANADGSRTVQIDFEAPARQLEAYRKLIATIRQALPNQVRLSVTALAHWCFQGDWLDRLPVDEVVPMLYRLGPDSDIWLHRLEQQKGGVAQRCQGPSFGFATNEVPPAALLKLALHPYWFNESAWLNPSHPPRDISQ